METIDSKTTIGQLASAFYNAITKEAEQNTIKSAIIEDNIIHGAVFNTKTTGSSFNEKMIMKLSINGKTFEFEHEWDGKETRWFINNGAFITRGLVDKMWENIKEEIVRAIAKTS